MTASSWVPGANGSGFGIENLPYGSAVLPSGERELVVRIGDQALRLGELQRAGLLEGLGCQPGTFAAPDLNLLLAAGKDVWSATRKRLIELLGGGDAALESDQGLRDRALVPLSECELVLPATIGDFVDMYSSIQHATNLGRLLRPDGDPLPPNWRHMPIGYHGRSGSVVVSGTPITRPNGQRQPEEGEDGPSFGPERMFDFELELGFLVGDGPPHGTPLDIVDAGDHIFGFFLVNDWSAREIQRWEYQPLGPNLSKSVATSAAPWVVPLEALEPLRVRNVAQEPSPLPHLRVDEDWGFDIALEVELQPAGGTPTVVTRGNARSVYWNVAQQLAHATSNGAPAKAGDLFATGTISGWERGTEGSMIELSRGGREPLDVGGVERTFLEDGDTVVLRGAGEYDGVKISLGEVGGTILPAPAKGS
jgi:fumarylacetoacetase